MAYRDLREFVAAMEQHGEVQRISAEVDWDLEIADVERRVLDLQGPALLFSNIRGYRQALCRRFFIGSLGSWRRIALALGLPKDTPPRELMRVQRERAHRPIKPVEVGTGPVKQNVLRAEEVNLLEQLPIPKYHERDGGRYLSTFNGVITRDPETGWVNVGLYRGMAHEDGRSIGVLLVMDSHWGRHAAKYAREGKAMPVAYAFGSDPLLPYVACSMYEPGVCEYEVLGGLRGFPLELVRCETVDLMVPADAEIVIEGYLSLDPKDFRMEGPFGEYTGFYGGVRSPKPVVHVTCMTFRDDPILTGSVEGHPYDDGALIEALTHSSFVLDRLQAQLQGVVDAWVPPVTHGNDVFVSIHKMYQGHAKQVAAALWGMCTWFFKNVIVVDDDVDVHDYDQLLWAISWRVWDPDEDVVFLRGAQGSVLDPSVPPELKDPVRMGGAGRWHRMLIDATRDWRLQPREEWGGDRFPPLNRYLPTPERVLRRWREYGFEG